MYASLRRSLVKSGKKGESLRRASRKLQESNEKELAAYNSLTAQARRHHPVCRREGCDGKGKRNCSGYCSLSCRGTPRLEGDRVLDRKRGGTRILVTKQSTGKSMPSA